MAASNSSNVPQGFSIYQPVLGAQLQFFPAVGTQELDQLLHAFIPGSASIQEKRASVALDFFEHLEVTGESFKFYPVYFMTTPVESPVTASPAQESGYASCFNESPVMSNWDWSQISQATSQSSNSRRRQTSKASVSRHQTAADFSHLPGMKIMTKDGRDVTNSASRGSKTKEQRDHAHLMRIIKACDSCRKKKVRCDPSHKKRSVAQAQSQPAQKSAAKKSKTKVAPQAQVANPAVVDNDFTTSLAPFELDPSFALTDLSSVSPAEATYESWEDFIQFPTANNTEDYDFLADPEGLFSSPESLTMSASSKPDTPVSTQYQPGAVGLPDPQPDIASSRLPYDQTESIHDYVDFNLYSPASSCSSLSASSPKPSIPEPRQENPGADELFSSCDFSLLTPSSEQVQHATSSFVGSGLSSIEGALTFSETPFDAAISRQNYYAGTDITNLDDYSVEVDVNHNKSRVGDDRNADSGTADTGESWYNDSPSAVIASTAIATSAIATVATIANADVNANDLQPTLAEHATHDEQQDSSRLNRRHDYSELIIGGLRRSRIESIDEGGTIATAIATPAIEALPQESTPTAEIATPALETYQQESSPAEIAASTGTTLPSPTMYHAPSGTLQPYDASSVILATSRTGAETNIVSQHIHSSLTDTATLRTTSLLLTSMLVSAYASGDMSVDSWKSATMMAILLCAVLCICYNLTHWGHRGQFCKGFFGRNEKQHAEKNDLVGLQSHWQALRCQASAATRSVGQIMSRAGTSIAV